MLLTTKKIKDSNVSVIEFKDYDSIELENTLKQFDSYRGRGIIQNDSFYDSVWRLNNFTTTYPVSFEINEILFEQEVNERTIGTLNDLTNAMKALILFKIESTAISGLYEQFSYLNNILHQTKLFNKKEIDKINLLKTNRKRDRRFLGLVLDFADFYYPLNVDSNYMENMTIVYEEFVEEDKIRRNRDKRNIGHFESAFRFNEVMDKYWAKATKKQKERFYPIKLWWEITTKIPLRVTELTLIPYDCVLLENGEYYLTVRRTSLKNSSDSKVVTHTIDGDYRLEKYRINKDLFNLIKEYKSFVDLYDLVPNFYGDYDDSCENVERRMYLFSYRAHYNFIGSELAKRAAAKKSRIKDYFSSLTLSHLLNSFFENVVMNEFSYDVVGKLENDNDLAANQIEQLSPMDTRHHAFINMVLNDIEPLFVKKIGGHESIDSSVHYFSHIDKYVKCFTYSMARRMAQKESHAKEGANMEYFEGIQSRDPLRYNRDSFREVQGGKCFSQQSLTDLEDCRKVSGNCLICYPYFQSEDNNDSLKKLIKENEESLTRESKSLERLVQTFRQAKNFDEQYMQKINAIKGFANQNAYLRCRLISSGGNGNSGEKK